MSAIVNPGGSGGDIRLLKATSVQASITGTTAKTALATFSIPAIPAGSQLRIFTQWKFTGGGGTKTVSVDFGPGPTTFAASPAPSGSLSGVLLTTINFPTTGTQIAGREAATVSGIGYGTVTNVTGTVDATVANTMTISMTLASGADSATLIGYSVELIPVV